MCLQLHTQFQSIQLQDEPFCGKTCDDDDGSETQKAFEFIFAENQFIVFTIVSQMAAAI